MDSDAKVGPRCGYYLHSNVKNLNLELCDNRRLIDGLQRPTLVHMLCAQSDSNTDPATLTADRYRYTTRRMTRSRIASTACYQNGEWRAPSSRERTVLC